MKGILLLILVATSIISGCIVSQRQPQIMVPVEPRVAIRGSAPAHEKTGGEYLYTDPTLGVIRNQGWPALVPRVWLLESGGRTLLMGRTQSGPPIATPGGEKEVHLPPGEHFLEVERWVYFPYYGGWRKLADTESVRLEVGREPKGKKFNWSVTIYKRRTSVRY